MCCRIARVVRGSGDISQLLDTLLLGRISCRLGPLIAQIHVLGADFLVVVLSMCSLMIVTDMKRLACVTTFFLAAAFASPRICHSQDCGAPPSLPTSIQNDENLKGQLQGQADFLSKLVGKAALSGEIKAAKKEIYQSSDQFFAAQKEAYLAYLFCLIIMKEKTLGPLDKIKALQEYRNAKSSDNTGAINPPSTTTKTSTYRHFVTRNGAWEGVDLLTSEEANHLGRSFEFTSTGNAQRVTQVRLRNGVNQCPAYDFDTITGDMSRRAAGFQSVTGDSLLNACSSARACTVKIHYNDEDLVDKQVFYDQFEHVIEQLQYPTPAVGQFVGAVLPCDHGKAGIRLLQFQRSVSGPTKGFDEKVRFLGKDGQPRPNNQGNYGLRLAHDEQGHTVMLSYMGPRGENWDVGSQHIATMRFMYNQKGVDEAVSFFDAAGNPTSNNHGVAQRRATYDTWGNLIEARFLDQNGNPTLDDSWAAGWRSSFDEHGDPIENTMFGLDGRPTLAKAGYASWRPKFDERGNEIEVTFLGIDGQPILAEEWAAQRKSTFDDRGNEIEAYYFDRYGKPTLTNDWCSSYEFQYDKRGNLIEKSCFGVDRSPAITKEFGAHKIRFSYTAEGRKISGSYFNADDQPATGKEGYSAWHSTLDEDGNELKALFFGINGQLVIINDGTAGRRSKFDERGNEVERVFIGVDDKPIPAKESGIVGWRKKFDERGNEVERVFIGIDGNPVITKDSGVAGWGSQFDNRRNNIEIAYFGVNREPILDKQNGVAGWRSKFDARGRETERVYYGTDGQKTLSKDLGIGGWRSKFDERGLLIEVAYFDRDKNPTFTKEGIASWRSKFDGRGNEMERIFLDTAGKPILSKDSGIAGWNKKFDERGNEVEHRFVDSSGNLILSKDGGVAGWRSKFDNGGNELERIFFGIDEKPILAKDSERAGWRKTFDERGNILEMTDLGTDGRPISTKDNFATTVYEYDPAGREISRHLLDASGKSVSAADTGRSIVQSTILET
jgi:YD repeat-containing protein